MDWELVKKIGYIASLIPLILLAKAIFNFFIRAKLKIYFDEAKDLRVYKFNDTGWIRKTGTLHIRNKRKQTAKRCVAILSILKKPETSKHVEEEISLHWAGVDYTSQTTGAEPVDIGPEPRRLDVAFTQRGQTINGCWIAMPFALSGSLERNQAYLLPGEYEVKIKVSCENGKGDVEKFTIFSPEEWDGLNMEPRKFFRIGGKIKTVKEEQSSSEPSKTQGIGFKLEHEASGDTTSCESGSHPSIGWSGVDNGTPSPGDEKRTYSDLAKEYIMPVELAQVNVKYKIVEQSQELHRYSLILDVENNSQSAFKDIVLELYFPEKLLEKKVWTHDHLTSSKHEKFPGYVCLTFIFNNMPERAKNLYSVHLLPGKTLRIFGKPGLTNLIYFMDNKLYEDVRDYKVWWNLYINNGMPQRGDLAFHKNLEKF